MIERGSSLRFLQKSFPVTFLELQLGRHALDGDHPLQSVIFRPIDLTHASGAEQTAEGKPSQDAARQIMDNRWHFDGVRWICH